MDEMLNFFVLACFMVLCTKAEYTVKCNNDSEPNISFEPSADGVKGRYTLVWCTEADKNVTEWDIHIRFNESKKPEQCKKSESRSRRPRLWSSHSDLKIDVNYNLNCTNACFSTSLDLIFEACYTIKNMLRRGAYSSEAFDYFHYVTNNLPDSKSLSQITPAVKYVPYEDHVSFTWFLKPIPAVRFTMNICKVNATPYQEACQDVTQNCTAEVYQIQCLLSPERDSYSIHLTHHAPWEYGSIAKSVFQSEFSFERSKEEVPAVGSRVWAWAVAAAALALLALAALLAFRARVSNGFRSSVLKAWQHTDEPEMSKANVEEGGRILLLYARDCAPLMEVVRQLKLLLQGAAGGVLDLYAPAAAAAAAAAPGDWLRGLLARPDTRVLLLQTPAAACLCGSQLRQRGAALALQRPLLGAQVVRRTPHAADALLQLALRLVSDAAAAPQPHALPYKKYFVAEISGLEADLVPLVTPQRRYLLPQGIAPLLAHLAPHNASLLQQSPQQLDQLLLPLQQAVEAALLYISDHPDYLNDELLFL